MNLKNNTVRLAVCAALGGVMLAPLSSSAVVIPDGNYRAVINNTPYSGGVYNFGTNGNWNSGFTFGCLPGSKGCQSQAMFDRATTVLGGDGVQRGSGIGGDGVAGVLNITVSGTTFTVSSFNVDTILSTAGGDFAQYIDTQSPTLSSSDGSSLMTGTIDQTTGEVSFIPTGRYGAITAPAVFFDRKWNTDDVTVPGNTLWRPFTTESSTNSTGTIAGKRLVSIGDVNGDGLADYNVILVTMAQVGTDWGSFATAAYSERWNMNVLSIAPPVAGTDTTTTTINTAKQISVLTNDSGTQPLSVTGATNGTNGTVTFTSTSVTYTPNTGYTGPDSFTYTLTDGNNSTATGTVNITVLAAGVPIANDDSATTGQNTAVTVNVVGNDTDTEDAGGTPGGTVAIATDASNGGCVVNGDRSITYTPDTGFVGTDSCTYTVQDNDTQSSDPATLRITVNASAQVDSGTFGAGSLGDADGAVTSAQLSSGGVPADDVENEGVVTPCIGGCFDFSVTGVTSPVRVVLTPLTTAITAQNVTDGTRYRKFINGAWRNFDISVGDQVASAPLTVGGGCPTPGDAGWKVWSDGTNPVADASHVGDRCIRLTIADNGPNDADAAANNVRDPSGAGAGIATASGGGVTPSPVLGDFTGSTGGGCTVSEHPVTFTERGDWWLVAGLLAALGIAARRKRSS